LLEEKKVGVASEAGGADVKTLLAMVKAAKAPVAAFLKSKPTGFLLLGAESVMNPFNRREGYSIEVGRMRNEFTIGYGRPTRDPTGVISN
jgi:hypothetical protein